MSKPQTQPRKTLKQLHQELTKLPATRREEIKAVLNVNNEQTPFDVINGTRKLNSAEKDAIAALYGCTADMIDWKDDQKLIG